MTYVFLLLSHNLLVAIQPFALLFQFLIYSLKVGYIVREDLVRKLLFHT